MANFSSNYPTIVTMMYNIRKTEGSDCESNHKQNYYLDLSKQFILTLPYPLIIFTSEDNEELCNEIYSARKEHLDKTEIIKINIEDTYYYKHLDRLYELQRIFHIQNGNLNHETPLYIILNNNKHFFMETSIVKNPFNSSHFVWCDFGINHVALNSEKIHEWILCVPDKIKQLCINPYLENRSDRDMFCWIYHHTAGGLFSGSSENLLLYSNLFKKKAEQMYQENWYQIDEAIMTIVQRENPDLFEFFYGDYQGIISNYIRPYHNMWLILRGIEKAINHDNKPFAYNILNYCHVYFEERINDGDIYRYISYRIGVDYYCNDKNLHDGVISIINKKMSENDEQLMAILTFNKDIIKSYTNKDLLLISFTD
jgi:hypothetical protein